MALECVSSKNNQKNNRFVDFWFRIRARYMHAEGKSGGEKQNPGLAGDLL